MINQNDTNLHHFSNIKEKGIKLDKHSAHRYAVISVSYRKSCYIQVTIYKGHKNVKSILKEMNRGKFKKQA